MKFLQNLMNHQVQIIILVHPCILNVILHFFNLFSLKNINRCASQIEDLINETMSFFHFALLKFENVF